MDLCIWIKQDIQEDQDELHGCKVDDYDSSTGEALIVVPHDELDPNFTATTETVKHEMWGSIFYDKETELRVKGCKWMGYEVLNADDVCEKLFEEGLA